MKKLLLLLPLLWLSACDGLFLETNKYTLVPPATPAGQACAKQCPVVKAQCLRICEAQKNNCLHSARVNAQRSYVQYVNDRMAQGLLVDKKESEFLTEARNCPQLEYCQERCHIGARACHSNCGGDVLQNGNCLLGCGPKTPEPQDEEGSFL